MNEAAVVAALAPLRDADGSPLIGPGDVAGVLTERMLTYALGRGLNYSDMPMVRKIVRNAAARNYRFSGLVLGVVESPAFQMKVVKKAAPANVAAILTQ